MLVQRMLPAAALAGLLAACSAGGASNGSGGEGGTGATGTGTGVGADGGSGVGGGFGGGMNPGGGEPLVAEVFGHSDDTLYRLDPLTHAVTVVGPFQGCSDVIDLAVDKDESIFATAYDGVYRIDPTNAACTQLLTGSYPNSLSFVPEGTVDLNDEALVGYLDSDYVRIDTTTGAIETLGSIGGGYISSGDIVSVIGGGTFLTVKGLDCSDCLFEVNPSNGAMVKNWGHLPYSQVFGLAFWGGRAYGFTNSGDLFEIAFGTDTVTTTAIPIPAAPADLSFWGAGSSTAAPLVPPT